MSGQTSAAAHAPADSHRALRALALAAVVIGVLALAAATFVLSYSGIHALALTAGVSASLARVYPVILDAMLVIACAAVLSLRGAGAVARLYAWLSMLVLLAAGAAAGAVHATGTRLPHRPAAAAAAIIPWVLVLIGFGLLMAMLRHARQRRLGGQRDAAGPGRQDQYPSPPEQRIGIHDLLRPAGPPPQLTTTSQVQLIPRTQEQLPPVPSAAPPVTTPPVTAPPATGSPGAGDDDAELAIDDAGQDDPVSEEASQAEDHDDPWLTGIPQEQAASSGYPARGLSPAPVPGYVAGRAPAGEDMVMAETAPAAAPAPARAGAGQPADQASAAQDEAVASGAGGRTHSSSDPDGSGPSGSGQGGSGQGGSGQGDDDQGDDDQGDDDRDNGEPDGGEPDGGEPDGRPGPVSAAPPQFNRLWSSPTPPEED